MTDNITAIIAELRETARMEDTCFRTNCRKLADRLEKLHGDAWQDIATAPKDGTHILAFSPDDHPYPLIYVVANRYGKWEEAAGEQYSYFSPIHWQPLPAPPQAGADPGPIVHPWDAVGTRNQPEPPLPG